MRIKLNHTEWTLLAACGGLLLLACLGPALAQPAGYHHFADQRGIWGIPHALDVLSNLPFALFGLAGLAALAMRPGPNRTVQACAALFFGGLLVTAAGSSLYHWRPDDAGLVLDRLGMVLPFAGLLGLAVADRVTRRAGGLTALAVLALGPLSVWVWSSTGNVLPWAAVQFGGMGLMLWLAALRPRPGALTVRWGTVILIYAVAKAFELADHPVFALTGHLVSGHMLKHVVASLSALPVIAAVWQASGRVNRVGTIALQQSDGGVAHVG